MKTHSTTILPNQPPNNLPLDPQGVLAKKWAAKPRRSLIVRSLPGDVRANEEWAPALRGDFGEEKQRVVHRQLVSYLFRASLNFLWKQQPIVHRLAQYDQEDLAALAQDFVQQLCYKLVKDEYAVLKSYKGNGRFLSWAAQVLHNLIRSEMRRREWHESERLDDEMLRQLRRPLIQQAGHPELTFQNNQLADLVENTLARLSDKNRVIFMRFIMDGERANIVANELGISASGVYTAAHRIREKMGKALIEAGYA